MRSADGAVDREIARLADAQRGIVTHAQLLDAGLDAHAIKRRRERNLLRIVHRGVYVVGHTALAPLALETAAVLACRPRALLSGLSSLSVWEVRKTQHGRSVELTVVGRNPGRRPGIILHRAAALHPCDIMYHRGLPLTSPARALLESASVLPSRDMERAVDEAIALELVDRPRLLAVVERYPGLRGTAMIRELADPQRASQITQRQAEERMVLLLRRAGAPPSRTQVWIGRYRVDRLWAEQRVVVEIDGWIFHRDRKRFESDQRRDGDLRAAGYVVLRFTRRQVMFEPEYVLFRLGQALSSVGLPARA